MIGKIFKKRPLILVDYENVQNKFLNYIDDDEKVDILIFFTVNNEKMDLVKVEQLLRSRRKRYYFTKVSCGGKNALDFQLASYLGYLIAKNRNREYIILSKDTGYAHVVDFWKKAGVNVKRRPCIEVAVSAQSKEEKEHQEWLIKFGGSDLQTKHKALVKKYGAKQGLKFYHEYKQLIKKQRGC